jgi:RNA polymerase sigma factor (sigma-70 family)
VGDPAKRADAQLLALTSGYANAEAFGVFYERHQRALLSFLWHRTGSFEAAEDLAAEAFSIALREVASYDPRRGNARAWLFGIARIAMLSSYRQRAAEDDGRRQMELTLRAYGDAAWEEAEARFDASLSEFVDGLAQLSQVEREAVVARVLEEHGYAEIARTQSASEAAIRQRVSRGLRHLGAQVRAREP